MAPTPQRRRDSARCAAALALLLPGLCSAHGAQDASGFLGGLLHPVFGFDHLLAMVSVGIVSAQLGGANIWRVPLGFVSAMVVGGMLGVLQMPLPAREWGIAASVVFLGLAIVRVTRHTSPWWPLAFVLFFGLCHGHAHGVEMPRSASPAFYTFGFLTSTTLLHLLGVLIGEVAVRREPLWKALRYAGVAMAGVGVSFMLGAMRG